MRARPQRKIAAAALLVAVALVDAGRAAARKPPKAPPPNADQQEVVAAVVEDVFKRPRRAPFSLALCLDVRVGPPLDEDAPAAPPPRRGAKKKKQAAPDPLPFLVVQGAPPELVARLARPWRVVSSASDCHLDPRAPITLGDGARTPAQLVTVHLQRDVAVGTFSIDWTAGGDTTATSSRDCTAARGPRGWTVQCGGTWVE